MWLSCRTLCLLALMLGFLHCFASEHDQQRRRLLFPSVMVIGTVYCDTCFQEEFLKSSHLISGASVAVECADHSTVKPIFRKEVKTDSHGVCRVRLPPTVSKHIYQIETCLVKLIRSNEPFCAAASSTRSSVFHLKSKINNVHVFSAGFFTFKPLKKPELCNQKRTITKGSSSSSSPSVTTSAIIDEQKQAQPEFFPFPTIPPLLPSPPPNFGGIPLPPNPLQPPSVLPPLPFQPSPPPLFGIPPIPFLTPPPPPPTILPPIPLLPSPLFPGIPPASP